MKNDGYSQTKKNRKIILEITLLLSLIFSLTFTPISSPNVKALTPTEVFDEEYDQYMNDFITITGGNSFAQALFNDTELVHLKGYGDKPGLDTVYQLGLISQLFTATAIMQLYEEGFVDLYADINEYLPYSVRHPNYPNTPISIKMLLTQNSSIRDSEPYWELTMAGGNFTELMYEFFHEDNAAVGSGWLSYKPGTVIYWSSLAYDLLAYIVENIVSKNFTQYVDENILIPLGMVNTKSNFSEYDESRLATPIVITNYSNATLPNRNYDGRGGVGWRTTIEDFYKFVYSFMHGSYEGISILNQASIDLMLTDYGESIGLGFLLGFRGYKAGRTSNIQQGPPPLPSLGCYSIFYFDDSVCIISLGGYHILHSELQDDSERFFIFVESALNELRQPTDSTDYDFAFLPVGICFLIIMLLLQRRNKTMRH